MMEKQVYLEKRKVYNYPKANMLYAPHILYPEYPFDVISDEPNDVYDMVRQSMIGLGLDEQHFGEPEWNPLGEYIAPGDTVIIKPNLVNNYDSMRQYECTLTHPSVIRAVIDYCVIAKAKHIIIGDAPIQGANLEQIVKDFSLDKIIEFYKKSNISIEFIDFRAFIANTDKNGMIIPIKDETNSDEYTVVHMGTTSKHYIKEAVAEYGICGYDDKKINKFHCGETHDYVISSKILQADVIINIPKPKTHRFAGITGAQKNFIGCCSDKESLPHFTRNSKCVCGDESSKKTIQTSLASYFAKMYMRACKSNDSMRAKIYRLPYRLFKKVSEISDYTQGMWYGNDTIWKTIIDFNKIVRYADKNGNLCLDIPQRKILTIGDMIVVGQKEGPLNPEGKEQGMILISRNCAVFDYVFCKIAGFDENKIPTVHHSIRNSALSITDWDKIKIFSNDFAVDKKDLVEVFFEEKDHFEPHPFWKAVL